MNFWCKNENPRIINVFVNISSENLIDFNTYIMASVCTVAITVTKDNKQLARNIHKQIISFPFRVMQKTRNGFLSIANIKEILKYAVKN